MAEYIERNKVLEMSYCPTPLSQDNPLADIKAVVDVEDIESIPTADVEEVKHGEWQQTTEPLGWQDVDCIECSVCRESWIMHEELSLDEYVQGWKYCPNCGAKMDGGKTK